MLVRVSRSLALTVNGQFVVIESGEFRTVSDDVRKAPEFARLVKSGDLAVVETSQSEPDPRPIDTTGTKKPSEVIQDVKTGKAAESAKPVPDATV